MESCFTWPWSVTPFRGIKKFEKLPYLKENDAFTFLSIGVTGAFILSWQVLVNLDPWAKTFWSYNELDNYFIVAFLLTLVTLLIAWKQYGYYYWTIGIGKQGLFKGSVKQVNWCEKSLDILLAFSGGLLLFFSGLPIYWFLMLSVYSLIVLLRCSVTISRKYFYEKLKNEGIEVPEWYIKTLEKKHNKNWVVKYVLCGWIISHGVISLYSLFIFLLFIPNFESLSIINRLLFLIITLIGLSLLYFGFSKLSYKFGKKICEWKDI